MIFSEHFSIFKTIRLKIDAKIGSWKSLNNFVANFALSFFLFLSKRQIIVIKCEKCRFLLNKTEFDELCWRRTNQFKLQTLQLFRIFLPFQWKHFNYLFGDFFFWFVIRFKFFLFACDSMVFARRKIWKPKTIFDSTISRYKNSFSKEESCAFY